MAALLAGSFSEKLSVRDENDMPPTLVLDPLPSGIEMIEPDVAVSDHELIRQLEQCCVEWISTIQVSTKYIERPSWCRTMLPCASFPWKRFISGKSEQGI